jgi:hypothetical protein
MPEKRKTKAGGVERVDPRTGCIFRVCKDPVTGKAVLVRGSKKCPAGFIEEIMDAMEKKGVVIRNG